MQSPNFIFNQEKPSYYEMLSLAHSTGQVSSRRTSLASSAGSGSASSVGSAISAKSYQSSCVSSSSKNNTHIEIEKENLKIKLANSQLKLELLEYKEGVEEMITQVFQEMAQKDELLELANREIQKLMDDIAVLKGQKMTKNDDQQPPLYASDTIAGSFAIISDESMARGSSSMSNDCTEATESSESMLPVKFDDVFRSNSSLYSENNETTNTKGKDSVFTFKETHLTGMTTPGKNYLKYIQDQPPSYSCEIISDETLEIGHEVSCSNHFPRQSTKTKLTDTNNYQSFVESSKILNEFDSEFLVQKMRETILEESIVDSSILEEQAVESWGMNVLRLVAESLVRNELIL